MASPSNDATDDLKQNEQKTKSMKQVQIKNLDIIQTVRVRNALVVSICISEFEDSDPLNGVKKDKETVNDLWGKFYKFDIIQNEKDYVDKTAFDALLESARKRLQENPHRYDGIIFVFSGHGDSGVVFSSDWERHHIDKIQQQFYGDQLPEFVSKPKIMFVDACRGGRNIEPVTRFKSKGPPPRKYHPGQDFVTFYGNVLDFTTIDFNKGGGLVQSMNYAFKLAASYNGEQNIDNIAMEMRYKLAELSEQQMIVEMISTAFQYITFGVKLDTDVVDGVYTIKNVISGLMMDVPYSSFESGKQIWQYTANGTNAQKFVIQQVDGYYLIKGMKGENGLVLDISGGSTEDGAALIQYKLNGTSGSENQQFKFVETGDGFYYIFNRKSGKLLDAQNSFKETPIVQNGPNGSREQKWNLTKV